MMRMIKLILGDCLEEMNNIDEHSIDCIIVDPPYQISNCEWDKMIPLKPMWEHIKRITKDTSAICIFGREPFSSYLRLSNINMFKYDWVWQKDKATNHLNAKKQPMRRNEIISVFYKKQCIYNPQLTKKDPKNIRPPTIKHIQSNLYGKMDKESKREIPINLTYPNETLRFRSCCGDKGKSLHPAQKPIDLLEYLLKTYTLEKQTILDFTMGSGSTGIACRNLNRNFIGIENNKKYFQIAENRLRR